jgi:hypothetical protein
MSELPCILLLPLLGMSLKQTARRMLLRTATLRPLPVRHARTSAEASGGTVSSWTHSANQLD